MQERMIGNAIMWPTNCGLINFNGAAVMQTRKRDWTYNGKKVGEVKETGFLTFATIRGAGHMMSTLFLPLN